MKKFLTSLFLLFQLSLLCGNSPIIISERFEWSIPDDKEAMSGEVSQALHFRGAVYSDLHPGFPFYVTQVPVNGPGRIEVVVLRVEYEDLAPGLAPSSGEITDRLNFRHSVRKFRDGYRATLSLIPIIRSGNTYRRVRSLSFEVVHRPEPRVSLRGPRNTRNSVLSQGEIYKMGVVERGIHKLSYAFLRDDLGIDVDEVDPATVQIFGNEGGILPPYLEAERQDDLAELSLQIVGGEDGSFDDGDYILFYAEGADKWRFDPESRRFAMEKNIYDDRNYYFLRLGVENGARVGERNSLPDAAFTTRSFDDFRRFEEDRLNLLHEWVRAQGSGQKWYGDHFRIQRTYEYDDLFVVPGLDISSPVSVRAEMALRALQGSRFRLGLNGREVESGSAARVTRLTGTGDNETSYARIARLESDIPVTGESLSFRVSYPHPGGPNDGSEGWLDFIEIQFRRDLRFSGDQFSFRDTRTLDHPESTYILENAGEDILIWDISRFQSPIRQIARAEQGNLTFTSPSDQLREFVAFSPEGELLRPEAAGRIDNQNLHALDDLDMLLLYPREFEAEALRLARHRESHSGLRVAAVEIGKVFHEFSSGRRDPTAIRDLVGMLYARNSAFRYLLLFGDGSFDTRNIYGLGNDFIPVYERESLNPLLAFPSDDYYGIVEENRRDDPLSGPLQIFAGRLPVKNESEARAVVDKIVHYDSSPRVLGNWRNRLAFVADDEDFNLHVDDADEIADELSEKFGSFNLDKIYLDAFPQVSTPGGNRFPGVTEAINRSILKGVLAVTYLGHGGSRGLAQERILNISDILGWQNFDRQTLFVTATCSFTGFDDAGFTTAGEEVLLNPRGGAIALYTTVRAVFAQQNARLTEETLEALFTRDGSRILTLGEAMAKAKNRLSLGGLLINSRKFLLIGDPAQKLAIPQYSVRTTEINGRTLASGQIDTLRALQSVTIGGEVIDEQGELIEDFSGIIYPTVFDKAATLTTLGQDSRSRPFEYELQKNVLFKGRATVTGGRFEFTFVVPRDINFELGKGKLSYYASDEQRLIDAAGSYENIVIGGTSDQAALDQEGPQVEVFMNTEDFVFGGLTDEDPTLLVKLRDDNGINVVGNSIGHDLEAVLDGDTQNTLLLNDFYESDIDDFRQGQVRFPLDDLQTGRHEIRVKAWDVANNSSEGYTEFVVAPSEGIALEHVLNYPNPFTDRTCFQFDHNIELEQMEVLVQIYTVSGRLVKTIERSLLSDGAIRLDDCIEWDGRDDYGDRLAKGVYLYKVRVRIPGMAISGLEGESDFEKLVILR
ncbi:MAG: type IX secretion system sortase PorU [Saprospiraceae bacterium]|nr:type IX secretion system sortase PorU [Saprospiraceae bacterium]